jgi:anti-sigma factor RsiW
MTHNSARIYGDCATGPDEYGHSEALARVQAYYDGELSARQAARIEAHLTECALCREELAALRSLAVILQAVPVAQVERSNECFAAQVALRLPRRPERTPVQQALLTGWRLVPVLVVGAWLFVQTAMLLTAGITALLALGIGTETLGAVVPAPGGGGPGWVVELAALLVAIGAPSAVPYVRHIGDILAGLLNAVSITSLLAPLIAALAISSWLATWAAAQRARP